jgi:hypothetical protein
VDKYDTLEYSRVKATAVSVRLWIYLCAFKNINRDPLAEFASQILKVKLSRTLNSMAPVNYSLLFKLQDVLTFLDILILEKS